MRPAFELPDFDQAQAFTFVREGDALASILRESPAGARLRLGAGRHRGVLGIERSVLIEGEPGAVLDGGGRGPVVHVVEDGLVVRLRGLVLSHGRAERGGGLFLDSWSDVGLEDVRLEANQAGWGRGAGLGISRGRLFARGLIGTEDQDIVATGVAELDLIGCAVGALQVWDGATVRLVGGTFSGGVSLRGTTSRRPQLHLSGDPLTLIHQHRELPGQVTRDG